MQIIIIIKYIISSKRNKTKEKTQQENSIYRRSRQQKQPEKIITKNNKHFQTRKQKREKTFLAVNVTCKINFKWNAYKNEQQQKKKQQNLKSMAKNKNNEKYIWKIIYIYIYII